MIKSVKFKDAILPLTVTSWIIGSGGIVEFPLDRPQLLFSLFYSATCIFIYSVMIYIVGFYYNNLIPKSIEDENGSLMSIYKTINNVTFYMGCFSIFSTIIMGWTRGHVCLINQQKY